MKSKIVILSDIKKGNKRLCLSAKRALGLCFKCIQYKTCESKIKNKHFEDLTNLKKEAQKTTERIDKIIADL